MDLPVGARVECSDGACGHVTRIVLNPKTHEVTEVVVRTGTLTPHEHLVPLNLVTSGTKEQIDIALTAQELSQQMLFVETRYVRLDREQARDPSLFPEYLNEYDRSMIIYPYAQPAMPAPRGADVQHEAIAPEDLALSRGAHVEASDGHVGRIDEFVVDNQGRITHVILSEGHLFGHREVDIPISAIDHMANNVVYLKIDRDAVGELPYVDVRGRD